MAKRKSNSKRPRKTRWVYSVEGPEALRTFYTRRRAIVFARNLVARSCGQTFVEKVKQNPAGVKTNWDSKGNQISKVIWEGQGKR